MHVANYMEKSLLEMLPVQQHRHCLLTIPHCHKDRRVLQCPLSRASLSCSEQISLLHSSDPGFSLAGGPDNQVHFEGYQVSNQCMALVRDECLLPCRDAPELGYAKESSSEQYVPDVFYKVSAACSWVGELRKQLCCVPGNRHGQLRKGCL